MFGLGAGLTGRSFRAGRQPTTLDPFNKTSSSVTLSNGNLTATGTTSPYPTVRATRGASTGKKFYSVLFGASPFQSAGVANGAFPFDGTQPSNPDAAALYGDGTIYGNNANIGGTGPGPVGAVCDISVDLDAKLFWARFGGGNWNFSGSANPATGVGGINVSFLGSGTVYPIFGPYDGAHTVNFGSSAYTHAAPSGFENW